jgi:hypothetical protein
MQHDPKDDSSESMLTRFLTAKSESISDELLRAIIDEHANPIIKKILRSKLVRARWFFECHWLSVSY